MITQFHSQPLNMTSKTENLLLLIQRDRYGALSVTSASFSILLSDPYVYHSSFLSSPPRPMLWSVCGRCCFGSRSLACLAPICPTIAESNIRHSSLSLTHTHSLCGSQPAHTHTQTLTMCFIVKYISSLRIKPFIDWADI